jgi:hypothetical protein
VHGTSQEKATRRDLRRLDAALHDVEKAYESLVTSSDYGAPAVGSKAEADVEAAEARSIPESLWGRERIDTLHALILLRLAAASDNLAATGTLLGQKGEGVYSPWTAARSVLEAAGIAYWLLDPALGLEARISRAFTDRLVSIRGAARFGSKIGATFDFEQRSDEVAETARSLGLQVSGTGLKRYVGEPFPTKTEVVTELLGTQLSPANYSLFSAWAHGEAWALLDTVQRGEDHEDPSGAGRRLRRASITFDHYQFIAAISARGFVNAVNRGLGYFGWASLDWERRVQNAFRSIGKAPTLVE